MSVYDEEKKTLKGFLAFRKSQYVRGESYTPKAVYGDMPEKPVEKNPAPIDSANLPKGIVRNTDAIKLRSSSDKVARGYRPREWNDYCHDGASDMPKDRERVVPKLAKPRPDSPFKRSGKALSNVVIVRKKLG